MPIVGGQGDEYVPFRQARPDVLRAPLAPIAIGLAAGIAVDSYHAVPLIVALGVFAIGLAGFAVPAHRAGLRFAILGLAAVGPGAMLHDHAYRDVPENHLVAHLGPEPRLAAVTGTLLSPPITSQPDAGAFTRWLRSGPRTRFVIQAETIDTPNGPVDVTGVVTVYVREPQLNLRPGERIKAFGWLSTTRPPANPGAFDWAKHQHRRGMFVTLFVKNAAAVRPIDSPPQNVWIRLRDGLRRWTMRALFEDVTPDESGAETLLAAMILGQRSQVDRAINDAFLRTGTAHFLAVSGVHVGILGFFVWMACGLAGINRRTAAVVIAATVLIYAVLAEPRPSIIRATILVLFGMMTIIIRRPFSRSNWVAAAAILILVWRPTDLFDIGFQLSFACVLAIAHLEPHVRDVVRKGFRLPSDDVLQLQVLPRGWWPRVLPRVTTNVVVAISTALSAWLVATPIIALYFGRVSPLGWFNSLILLPPVMFVMFAGFAKLLLALIIPASSVLTGPMLAFATVVLAAIAQWLAGIPGVSLEVPSPPVWWVWLYLATVVLWTTRLWLRLSWRAPAVLTVVTAIAVAGWYGGGLRGRDDVVTVHVLSVGDGSATVIELPDGKTWLYDVGSLSAYDVGRRTVLPFLRQAGVDRIDTIVLSHANLDHYSGALSIADGLPVDKWILSPHFDAHSPPNSPGRHLLTELQRRGVAIRNVTAGANLGATDGVTIETLWPPPPASGDALSPNESSLVLRIRFAGRSVLLCGDIEEDAELALLQRGGLEADVLVLPHHGSVVSTTEAFIESVGPTVLVRSSGQPDRETINGLLDMIHDRTYFNTADDGAVTVRLGPDGVTVTAFRPRGNTVRRAR